MMRTVNGALCRHTGCDDVPVSVDRAGREDKNGSFYRMQMEPPVPQRFEIIRKSNLIGVNNDLKEIFIARLHAAIRN